MLTADVDDFTGTDGDDTFTAGLSVAGNQTLTSIDRIDGGEGTDRLNATLTANVALDGVIENVENLYFRALNGVAVDMANVAGVEQIWSDRAQDNFTVNNQENAVTLGVIAGEGDATILGYDVDSTTDLAQAVVLQGANLANAQGAAQGTLAVNNAGTAEFNAINITNSGESFFSAVTSDSFADEVALNVEGSGSLQIDTALAANVNTVGAGDFEGNLTLDLSNNASDLDVTLGAGDDSLTVNGAELDADDSIDMGAGENTLTLGTVTDLSANFSGVTNVQALGFVETQDIGATTTGLDVGTISEVSFNDGLTGDGVTNFNAATLVNATGVMTDGDTVVAGGVTYTRGATNFTATGGTVTDAASATAVQNQTEAITQGVNTFNVVFATNGDVALIDGIAPTATNTLRYNTVTDTLSVGNPAESADFIDAADAATLFNGATVDVAFTAEFGDITINSDGTAAGNSYTEAGLTATEVATGGTIAGGVSGNDGQFTIGSDSFFWETATTTLFTGTDNTGDEVNFTGTELTTDDSAVATVELDSEAAELTVNFEGTNSEDVALSVSDEVSGLTVNATSTAVGTAGHTVTVTNQEDADGDQESLETLTLADTSTPNAAGVLMASSYDVALSNVEGLTTINLAGTAGVDGNDDAVASNFTVDAGAASFGGAVTVNISDVNDVTYNNAQETVRETFAFGGELVEGGTITINDFNFTTGANGDKLDFSEYGLSAGDLTIVENSGDFTITSDAFDGTIVINTVGSPEPSFFEANAFA
ncbi:beta strand repeat-containing protein [Vreelandella lionensis]|uniref:beta strand repeat-containing protein n=1 Tax=Vreelandella lionensis TaxID=1144478 RepID=UPI00111C6C37|nr:hypothetical protein [Halomonas lionensis]